jgi:hypothetical protein
VLTKGSHHEGALPYRLVVSIFCIWLKSSIDNGSFLPGPTRTKNVRLKPIFAGFFSGPFFCENRTPI